MSYQCPLCHHPLSLSENSYRCVNNHSFDLAKEGYVNLMPVQHKRSKDPGDNQQMMQARRRFLQHDYYQPMRSRVAQLCSEGLTSSATILDIGCGEGYYSRQLNAHAGLDIAKDGVRMAAKAHPSGQYVVGSAYRLPYEENSFDTLVCVFSPLDFDEALRVLRPGGRIYWVGPGAGHLSQLAKLVYAEVKPHVLKPPSAHLTAIDSVHFSINLTGPELADLLHMTPYYWSASEDKQAAIAELDRHQVDCEFELFSFVSPKSNSD